MATCILPCLIYSSQTQMFTTKLTNKIRNYQRAIERHMLHLRKIKKKTRSEEIRKMTNLTDALYQTIKLIMVLGRSCSQMLCPTMDSQENKMDRLIRKKKRGRPKTMGRRYIISGREELDENSAEKRKLEEIGGGLKLFKTFL